MTDHVRSDVANGVLTLTLNRPEKKNALTRAMYQALGDGIDGAAAATEVRCILIQAEGDAFTAGNDLGDFAAISQGEPADAVRAGGNPLLVALARAVTPVVAAVNGRAARVGRQADQGADAGFCRPRRADGNRGRALRRPAEGCGSPGGFHRLCRETRARFLARLPDDLRPERRQP
jgi:enoyl-CoA hydratase/carnithine racemase